MDSPLAGLMVVLASDTLIHTWLDLLEAAGRHVLIRLPLYSPQSVHYFLFFSVIVLYLFHGQ